MDDESVSLDYSDVLSSIDSNVSDLAQSFVIGDGSTTIGDAVEQINEQLSNIAVLLNTDVSVSADVASTVALDSTQFDQLMTLQTSELTVLLFILAFVIMIFGVLLAHLFMCNWRV